ncbi:MAG: hypothetical protein LDL56_01690 [Armatimonadetes bacterium]|nr:hypothetical protein [Armatimonadota bacterium]
MKTSVALICATALALAWLVRDRALVVETRHVIHLTLDLTPLVRKDR